jgi:hypothetical protein
MFIIICEHAPNARITPTHPHLKQPPTFCATHCHSAHTTSIATALHDADGWCAILVGCSTLPLYHDGIRTIILNTTSGEQQLGPMNTPATYALWIGLPAGFLCCSCCFCCLCCCCSCFPEKPAFEAHGAEAISGRMSMGWLVDLSERFSRAMPRNSMAQRVSQRLTRASSRFSRNVGGFGAVASRASQQAARVSLRSSVSRSSAAYSSRTSAQVTPAPEPSAAPDALIPGGYRGDKRCSLQANVSSPTPGKVTWGGGLSPLQRKIAST